MSHQCDHGKPGSVYDVTQQAVGFAVRTHVKGKILAKRINVRIEQIKPSEGRDSLLQRVKENDQKKKDAKEKDLGSPGASACSTRRRSSVSTTGKEPELVNPSLWSLGEYEQNDKLDMSLSLALLTPDCVVSTISKCRVLDKRRQLDDPIYQDDGTITSEHRFKSFASSSIRLLCYG
uniref:60S ribosomal protein L21 n=1 Tax=Molossus molossus TaxID=27622 RepID=A0A7J8HHZ5_MOLMO|nr:hypothetical protein HJG59_011067 [Molossus molossus]